MVLTSKKTISVYIPTHLVISFIWNHQSFIKCSRVRICFILLLQKMVSENVCCEKLLLYLNWNHQHICKECSQTQNTHLLYMKLLSMWYFELQPDYVESTYTPELPGRLPCFLLMLKRQCIRVWLFKLVVFR